jgi:3-oxoadipate enol-lactonase
MDHLGCARAHIVGNSAGGYLGQQLAMEPRRASDCAIFAAPAERGPR